MSTMISPGRAAQSPLSLAVRAAEDRVLRPFLFYHVLTPEQLCRLLYKPGSLTFAYDVLAGLAKKEYLQVIRYPRSFPGRSQNVYTLARKGIRYLAGEGLDVPERYHAGELAQLSRGHLDHTLAVNDAFISLEGLTRDSQQVVVARRIHDRTLKKQGTKIAVKVGERTPVTVPVIFDGWVDLHVAGRTRVCLGLEVERSVKQKDRWREKVAALVSWSREGYQAQFGTKTLTVAVFTTLGDNHRQGLLTLTSQTLEELGERGEADLFRFSSVPPVSDPRAIWSARCWYRPFDPEPLSLLPETN